MALIALGVAASGRLLQCATKPHAQPYVAIFGAKGAGAALLIWMRDGHEGWIYAPPGASPLAITAGPGNRVAFSSTPGRIQFRGNLLPGGALVGQLRALERDYWGNPFGLGPAWRPTSWTKLEIDSHCPIRPGLYSDLKYFPDEGEWLGTQLFVFGCGRGVVGFLTTFFGGPDNSGPLYLVRKAPRSMSVEATDVSIKGNTPVYTKSTIEILATAHGVELRPGPAESGGPERLSWRGRATSPPSP